MIKFSMQFREPQPIGLTHLQLISKITETLILRSDYNLGAQV